ncbi:chitobiase/beta-hexosaminidase C-terminal domain-containing protein [Streptomyces formicae]|uniref:Purple acid phosphatase/fibronectin domain protein n=1 Tax=Streptomyces formicae TaxID=1616117 RepID=A0A291QME8_9ACTN|nr:chitobiase/beta-hexosaminidase C-terminal domain-containing protein [Streptomyces formicae]ATL32879.1 Purple acid phosphatase/fibronectin domain protein [Streptomyces formicae]
MRPAPFALGAASLALLLPISAHAVTVPAVAPTASAAASDAAHATPAAPTFARPGGRYERPVSLALRAERGATVRYTLDGTTPTRASRAYVTGRPLRITEDTNVTAVAFRGRRASLPVSAGYLVKTAEKPLARLVVMSDVHIGDHKNNDKKYESFFDTIGSVFPEPDAILSNGDMINDNGDGRGADHRIVSEIFRANLKRKGMDDTQVLLSNGNHDASLADIRANYPRDWFPDAGGGYYESKVKGLHLFTVNTETYNSDAAQRAWLKKRLAELTADPAAARTPVLVQGHRPAPRTTMDGQQAANPLLTEDLSAFPQVMYFSGHSHLNINDERSVHQRDFTAVNDGSMSYVEMDHGYQAVTETGLADRFEAPTAQALFVEVYRDRTEIARVNMAADKHDIYTDGKWSANWQPPYASAGTLSGPTWTVRLKGRTPQEIKKGFTYTDARRNTTAPRFTSARPLSVVGRSKGEKALRVAQAKDDQMVHHYRVDIRDKATGAELLNSKALAEYYFMPRPRSLDIPVPATKRGARYVARVSAVDAYGNASRTASVVFTG